MEQNEAIAELVALWRKSASKCFCTREKQRGQVWEDCGAFDRPEHIVECGNEFFACRAWGESRQVRWAHFQKYAGGWRYDRRMRDESRRQTEAVLRGRAEQVRRVADPAWREAQVERMGRIRATLVGKGNRAERAPARARMPEGRGGQHPFEGFDDVPEDEIPF